MAVKLASGRPSGPAGPCQGRGPAGARQLLGEGRTSCVQCEAGGGFRVTGGPETQLRPSVQVPAVLPQSAHRTCTRTSTNATSISTLAGCRPWATTCPGRSLSGSPLCSTMCSVRQMQPRGSQAATRAAKRAINCMLPNPCAAAERQRNPQTGRSSTIEACHLLHAAALHPLVMCLSAASHAALFPP